MKKLQKREKVLLIVLLVILVAVVPFVLLIFPVMQQNTGKADTLAVLEVSRMEMETRLAAKPALETALAEIEERYAENEELIPPAMKNYDIHYLVSDICSKAGVTLDSLSIGEYEAQTAASSRNRSKAHSFRAWCCSSRQPEISSRRRTSSSSFTNSLIWWSRNFISTWKTRSCRRQLLSRRSFTRWHSRETRRLTPQQQRRNRPRRTRRTQPGRRHQSENRDR